MTPHEDLKRRILLMLLKVLTFASMVATIIHILETNTAPINLIVPPLSAIGFFVLTIRLQQTPESLPQVTRLFALILTIALTISSWYFVGFAIAIPDLTLIDTLPAPLVSAIPLVGLILLIFIRPYQWEKILVLSWLITAAPIFFYLLLHPAEFNTMRGQEIAFLTGPTIVGQIVFILFYVRLQDMVDRLYTERLQYYSKILEKQAIRQQAIEQTFTQIHNGPLQTLAVFLRDVRGETLRSPELIERLEQLDREIRAIGNCLVDEENPTPIVGKIPALEDGFSDWILRLGSGSNLDLNLPLNELFYQVFSATIARDFPYFQTLRVKMRNFEVCPASLDCDRKRELCLWLEEAICNVGKHAKGVTRITATGKFARGQYTLTVRDNGCGIQSDRIHSSTQQHHKLAQRLGGNFRRESLPTKGTLCELSFQLSVKI
ncbi:MAG: hypothetical protein AB4290_13380 [Spirulina sp.]